MNKIFLYTLFTFALFSACKKSDHSAPAPGRFEINTKTSSVDGNLIMGEAVTAANTLTLAISNGKAATATISADTVNGLSIKLTNISLSKDSVKVPLSGTPVIDGTFFTNS